MSPGDRVRLTDEYVNDSTNPALSREFRGKVIEPTEHVRTLPAYTLVWWDGNIEPYPVLTKYLTTD